jgi:hypothetical protein
MYKVWDGIHLSSLVQELEDPDWNSDVDSLSAACAALNNFLKLLYYRGKTGKFVQELTADFRQV